MNELKEALPQAWDRCSCGRLMTLVFGIDSTMPHGNQIMWCAGCGELNVHYNSRRENDSRYKPNPSLIGVP